MLDLLVFELFSFSKLIVCFWNDKILVCVLFCFSSNKLDNNSNDEYCRMSAFNTFVVVQGSLMQRITNMEMLKLSHWNPAKDMLGVLIEIKEVLQCWARCVAYLEISITALLCVSVMLYFERYFFYILKSSCVLLLDWT